MNDQPRTYVRRIWDVHPGETADKPTERDMNEQQEVPQHRDPELPRPVSKAVYEYGLCTWIQELGEYATTVHDAGAPDICSNDVKHVRSCSQLVFGSRSAQSASVKLFATSGYGSSHVGTRLSSRSSSQAFAIHHRSSSQNNCRLLTPRPKTAAVSAARGLGSLSRTPNECDSHVLSVGGQTSLPCS